MNKLPEEDLKKPEAMSHTPSTPGSMDGGAANERTSSILQNHYVLAVHEIGVKRISVGSALSRAALGAFLRAAREMRESGTFAFAAEAVSYREISALFGA
jgi:hypothetical protein